ncbi:MAG: 3-deoxy-7-phosphoheptulonate synthase [Candidatus Wallbacteria bacterium]|nr:3-deoxy-7-phosphoheptulonate synthase [Candidatus Wallbacteria bacterium]
MIVIFSPDVVPGGEEVQRLLERARHFPNVTPQVHVVQGETRSLTEVYLIGETRAIPDDEMSDLPGVERVVRVSEKYRLIGRHKGQMEALACEYNGVGFEQGTFNLLAGLCAVDTRDNVEKTFRALEALGLATARMGAYKPRTSPYDFQGRGGACLSYVFELAGKYGIRMIAMEVLHESHVEEILDALHRSGNATGVMLQIGTRNAQNFELLRAVGQQQELPVLVKRGMGITLEESLNACEYVAVNGNRRIVICLRGVKTHLGDPHRNFVDFAHVPVVKRLTRLPVCVDPSHAVGRKDRAPDGITDLAHATAQGIIAGCEMVLADVHPNPAEALCDGPQALLLEELPGFLEDCRIVRRAYEQRAALAARH